LTPRIAILDSCRSSIC